MINFKAEQFFDFSSFVHKGVFLLDQPVWETLNNISSFIKNWFITNLNNKDIFIGKGTIIDPGAKIIGPAIIGKNCQIRHGAYIRGEVIIGDNCIIGNSTEIKNSILLNDVQAAHFNYIGDSILGNKVNLGAGVKLANVRLDKEKISIKAGTKVIKTNFIKFGSVLGDEVSVGCNAVFNPGTIIGKKSLVYPLTLVKGFFPDNSIIKK